MSAPLTPERHDSLWEALLLLGETVHDIRRMADAVDRGVASRDACRAFADRVSAARATIGRAALSQPARTCGRCKHFRPWFPDGKSISGYPDERGDTPPAVDPPALVALVQEYQKADRAYNTEVVMRGGSVLTATIERFLRAKRQILAWTPDAAAPPVATRTDELTVEDRLKALEWAESAGQRQQIAEIPDLPQHLKTSTLKRAARDMALARQLLKLDPIAAHGE